MFVLSAIFALATVAAGFPMHDGRIVGGENTTIEEYPHQVSLEDSEGFLFCGGSLIADNYVVTEAHCVIQRSATKFFVRAATTIRSTEGIRVAIEKVAYNPDFSFSKRDGDVAVLKLKTPIPLSDKAKPIALVPMNKEPAPNETLTVTGWGITVPGDAYLPEVLQVVQVPAVEREVCRRAYGQDQITDTMICAGVVLKDSCNGDSGGPLINSKRELVGIVSWGRSCGFSGYPGVYGSVASTFIHNFITNAVTETQG